MRGHGCGAQSLEHRGREAVAAGKRRAVLQVIASNTGARAFYRALGYTDDGPTHGRLRSVLAFPSVLMHKDVG